MKRVMKQTKKKPKRRRTEFVIRCVDKGNEMEEMPDEIIHGNRLEEMPNECAGGDFNEIPDDGENEEVCDESELALNKFKDELISEVYNKLKNSSELVPNEKIERPVPQRFQTPPYILTEQILFRSWYRRLKSEIEAYEYLDIIDPKVKEFYNYSENERKRRKSNVRNIILSRLDEKHLRLVENEDDLVRIIKRLEAHRESKTVAGELSYLKELHTMSFDPKKQNIQDFLLHLNNLFTKVEESEGEPYSDSRKKKILMIAVSEIYPELIVIDRAQEGRMTYDQAQQIIIEESALRRENEIRNATKNVSNVFAAKVKPNKRVNSIKKTCFNCGQWGHLPATCPNHGKKLCYSCKEFVTDHLSKNCPNKKFNPPHRIIPKRDYPTQEKINRTKPKIIRQLKSKKTYHANYVKFDSDDEFEYLRLNGESDANYCDVENFVGNVDGNEPDDLYW